MICDEAVDDSIAALKIASKFVNLFVTSKTIKNLYTALCSDQNILCFNEYSGDALFSCNEMDILSIDL